MQYELNAVEARVLGCLIEKQSTTPDTYPLSLHSLTLACNQKSNRDPVMKLDEQAAAKAIDSLRDKNLAQAVSQAASRVMKYAHMADRTLAVDKKHLALLCELLLRGPQTAGELRGRAMRMASFENIGEVEQAMADLASRSPEPLAMLLPRQPGRKEPRYAHLLSGEINLDELAASAAAGTEPQAEDGRLEKLETETASLRQDIASLQAQFAEFRKLLE